MHITKKPRPPIVRGVEPINDAHDITFQGTEYVYLNLYNKEGEYGPKDVRVLQDSLVIKLDSVRAIAEGLMRVAAQIETGEITPEDDGNSDGEEGPAEFSNSLVAKMADYPVNPWWKDTATKEYK